MSGRLILFTLFESEQEVRVDSWPAVGDNFWTRVDFCLLVGLTQSV